MDPRFDERVNYHYLLVEVDASRMMITMNRLGMKDGKATWIQPDRIEITVPDPPAKEK